MATESFRIMCRMQARFALLASLAPCDGNGCGPARQFFEAVKCGSSPADASEVRPSAVRRRTRLQDK